MQGLREFRTDNRRYHRILCFFFSPKMCYQMTLWNYYSNICYHISLSNLHNLQQFLRIAPWLQEHKLNALKRLFYLYLSANWNSSFRLAKKMITCHKTSLNPSITFRIGGICPISKPDFRVVAN